MKLDIAAEAKRLKALMDEQGKLRALEKKIKADGANSKLILTKMVADSKDFINRLEDAEYHRCVAYGNTAEVLGKYLTK